MDYAVDDGGGDHGIPQVIAELLKINVRSDKRAALAVPAIDDLEEEGGVPRVLLFQPVKAKFIDEQYLGRGIVSELPGEGVVGPAGHELREHVGSRRVAAPEEPGAAQKKQCFCDVALPRARVSGNQKPLLPLHEVKLRDLHDLGLIEPGLEVEVKVGKQLPFGKPGFLYPPFDPPFNQCVCLDGKEPFEELRRGKPFFCGFRQFFLKNLLDPDQLERFQMLPDPRQSFFR